MSNRQMIQLLLYALLLMVPLFAFILYQYRRFITEKNKDAIFIENKKSNARYLYASYQLFSQWVLTKFYIVKLRKRFEMLQPGDEVAVVQDTMKTAFKIWGISGLLIVTAAFTDISFYMLLVTISLVYIINSFITYNSVNQAEIKLRKQNIPLLENIRHYFYQSHMVEEAIYETIPKMENPILIHVEKMYQVLTDKNQEEAVIKFNDTVPNKYLKLLLSLCITTMKFGDRTVEGQSLFLKNISNLKVDILSDIQKKEKINHKLSGLVFIAVLPMYFLKVIEHWAIGNLVELEHYYKGAYGIILSIIICAGSLLIYSFLNHAKETDHVDQKDYVILNKLANMKLIRRFLNGYYDNNYGKMLAIEEMLRRMGESITGKLYILQRVILGIVAFVFCLGVSLTIHHNNRSDYLYNTNNLVSFSSAASEKELEVIKATITKYTVQYKGKAVTKKMIEKDLLAEGMIKNKILMTMTAEEVVSRVIKYNGEYFKWYELIIIVVISLVAYFVPYWMLLFRKRLMVMRMEDEVIQFHSIILMLMHNERMSAQDVLEWIESFAVIFRASITECLNNYAAGDIKALEELKSKEPFEPFAKLVDNLLMCDKIRLEKAFDEVLIERKIFQEKRKQEDDIYIDNKSALSTFLAFIPLVTVIIFYITVPFVVESLTQLYSCFSQMQAIK